MDSDTTSRSVRIPTFDGDKKNLAIWNTRFQTYAGMLGFEVEISEDKDANLPEQHDTDIDEDTPEGKKQAKAKRQNVYVFANYTLAFTTKYFLSKTESEKTD